MKAIIDDKIPYINGKIEKFVDEVVYIKGSEITASDVHDADVLIVRTRTRCNASLLEGSKVRLVVTATIGFDHLDTEYLEKAGIEWHNCPGCNASSVRQYVHNSLIALGILPNSYEKASNSQGTTIGVIGLGHVGSLVAEDMKESGLQVIYYDPFVANDNYERANSMDEIAKRCDIITFHTLLSNTGEYPSYHLADKAFFNSLKRKPIVINSSRGPVADNEAMLDALRNGLISNAVVDTWEGEPDMNKDLLKEAKIATPHIAGYSADGKANATRMSLEHLCRFIGKEMNEEIVPPQLPEGDYSTPLSLYNPMDDTTLLKESPEKFEYFRGNYPLRRETV